MRSVIYMFQPFVLRDDRRRRDFGIGSGQCGIRKCRPGEWQCGGADARKTHVITCLDGLSVEWRANPGAWSREETTTVKMLPNDAMGPIFRATVEATEEAVLNAMVAARTMTGINGNVVNALPHGLLRDVLK
jgi:hypothetical protein